MQKKSIRNANKEKKDDWTNDDLSRLKKQQFLNETLSKIPLVIPADPKLLVKGNQPNFNFIDDPMIDKSHCIKK